MLRPSVSQRSHAATEYLGSVYETGAFADSSLRIGCKRFEEV